MGKRISSAQLNKKNKVINRLRTRKTVEATLDQQGQDLHLIDLVLEKLYNKGDKQTASLEEDVLTVHKIRYTQSGRERLWDLLVNTGFVQPVIGFGKSGRLSLTSEGYQLMTRFGSYSNFINERARQAQAQTQGQAAPQFIITQAAGAAEPEKPESESFEEGTPDKPAAAGAADLQL